VGGRLEGLDAFGEDGAAAAQEIDTVGTCLPERGGHGEANPWGGAVSLPLRNVEGTEDGSEVLGCWGNSGTGSHHRLRL